MWWMVDVGFSHVLDENNLTQAQEKCLDLDIQATTIMYKSLHDNIFGEIIDMKTAHEIWSYLILMCPLLGLILIVGNRPIFLIEITPNLMGGFHVNDFSKYAIMQRSTHDISSMDVKI